MNKYWVRRIGAHYRIYHKNQTNSWPFGKRVKCSVNRVTIAVSPSVSSENSKKISSIMIHYAIWNLISHIVHVWMERSSQNIMWYITYFCLDKLIRYNIIKVMQANQHNTDRMKAVLARNLAWFFFTTQFLFMNVFFSRQNHAKSLENKCFSMRSGDVSNIEGFINLKEFIQIYNTE